MAPAALRRIDFVVFKDKAPGDTTQVTWGGARVIFYRQGATVKDQATISDGAEVDVNVYGTGRVAEDDTVQAGSLGPPLSVTSVDSHEKKIKLKNTTGATIVIAAQTRLVIVAPFSSLPQVYSDPFGTVPLGNAITADANGRVTGYISERKFDYAVGGVGFDSVSQSYIGDDNYTSWQHSASGTDRCVLVCISWTGVEGSESIQSVTYGGLPMTPVVEGFASIYRLVNPPTGPKLVEVSFNGAVTAIVAAISLTSVDQSNPIVSQQSAFGQSTTPSVVLPTTLLGSLVLDTLRVGGGVFTDAGTAEHDPGQTSRWNVALGTVDPPIYTLTRGAGSTRTGGPKMSWVLSGTSPPVPNWGMAGVALRPILVRLHIDAEGPIFGATATLNALDYPTLRAALDDVPVNGFLYIPPGLYNASSKPRYDSTLLLPSNKTIHVLGAGPDITILEAEFDDAMARIQGNFQTIEGLTLKHKSPGTGSQKDGIVIQPVTNPLVRVAVLNCKLVDHRQWGIKFQIDSDHGAVVAFIEGVIIEKPNVSNMDGGGMSIADTTSTTAIYCSRCRINQFSGYGIYAKGVRGLSLIDSVIQDGDDTQAFLKLVGCSSAHIEHCWFRHAMGSAASPNNYFIDMAADPSTGLYTGIVIEDCMFVRDYTVQSPPTSLSPKIIHAGVGGRNLRISNPTVKCPVAFTGDAIVFDYLANPEAFVDGVVLGGSGYTDSAPFDLRISDNDASRTSYIGVNRRIRLPRVANDTDRGNLVNVAIGDMIYNRSGHKIQVCTGYGANQTPVWTDLNLP